MTIIIVGNYSNKPQRGKATDHRQNGLVQHQARTSTTRSSAKIEGPTPSANSTEIAGSKTCQSAQRLWTRESSGKRVDDASSPPATTATKQRFVDFGGIRDFGGVLKRVLALHLFQISAVFFSCFSDHFLNWGGCRYCIPRNNELSPTVLYQTSKLSTLDKPSTLQQEKASIFQPLYQSFLLSLIYVSSTTRMNFVKALFLPLACSVFIGTALAERSLKVSLV